MQMLCVQSIKQRLLMLIALLLALQYRTAAAGLPEEWLTEVGLTQRPASGDVPVTGFFTAISASTASISMAFRAFKQINAPGFCHTIRLINLPSPNPSPLMSGSEFTLLHASEQYNGRYAWSNGKEYLSYVTVPGREFGNWLIGVSPGQDNGYVYIATSRHSLTPLLLESAYGSGSDWMWLMNGTWQEQPSLRAVCIDEYKAGSRYYEVEYFDTETKQPVTTVMVSDIHPTLLSSGSVDTRAGWSVSDILKSDRGIDTAYSAFFDVKSSTWKEILNITPVASFGSPALIGHEKSDRSSVGVLLNAEHSGQGGWRLSFRNFPFSTGSNTKSTLKQSEVDASLGSMTETPADEVGITTRLTSIVATADTPYSPLSISALDKVAGEEEYYLQLDNDGMRDGHLLSKLTAGLKKNFHRTMQNNLRNVNPGDYLWVWFKPSKSQPSEEVTELLLHCFARSSDTILFKYYEPHRMLVMRQSIRQRDTDFIAVKCSKDTCKDFDIPLILFHEQPISFLSTIHLGSSILDYLWRYIEQREGQPNGLSACYLYHAAVTLPQPLVYAAEILCVMMGAKPVAMVQYVSPSEHQWKFPLVAELCQAIVAAKHLLGDSLEIDYEILKYGNDETVAIYRRNRRYLLDGLVPHGQAQALHPAPYPKEETLLQDWRAQIFNAAWNGFILGYPEYFILSYCETFHSDLPIHEKRQQFEVARKEVELYLEQNGDQFYRIQLGLDEPIDEWKYRTIKSLMI